MNININQNIKSILSLDHIYFQSFHFEHLGHSSTSSPNVSVKFDIHDNYDSSNESLTVHLTAKLKATELFSLDTELVGIFTVNGEWAEKLKANAVAIMFPYLRSQITLLTSQPEMMPIILPSVNINNLIKQQNNQS